MKIKLNELPVSERPYEKLEVFGAETLSNVELLAIIIKTGTKEETALDLAQRVISINQDNNSLKFLSQISIEELMNIKGIGRVKAIQIKAVCEIAKRLSRPINTKNIVIKKPKDVADLFMEELKYEQKEVLKVLILNTKNILQRVVNVAVGGTFSINIEPKDILKEAIKMGMPKIILLHNHPSGDASPSDSDVEITNRVKVCANMFGIQLLDHIVIGDGTYESIFSKYKR